VREEADSFFRTEVEKSSSAEGTTFDSFRGGSSSTSPGRLFVTEFSIADDVDGVLSRRLGLLSSWLAIEDRACAPGWTWGAVIGDMSFVFAIISSEFKDTSCAWHYERRR